jgi:hypothetical protein
MKMVFIEKCPKLLGKEYPIVIWFRPLLEVFPSSPPRQPVLMIKTPGQSVHQRVHWGMEQRAGPREDQAQGEVRIDDDSG